MTGTLEERVLAALDQVRDPCSIATRHPVSIVELGLLVRLEVTPEGDVKALLRPTSPSCTLIASIMQAAEAEVAAVPGVRAVSIEVDPRSDWFPELMTDAGREKLEAARADTVRRLGLRQRGGSADRGALARR